MRQTLKLAGSSAAAAGLMYFLDPDHGRRRRAMARNQVVHGWHRGADAVCTTSRDLRNRTVGLAMRLPPLSTLAVPDLIPDAVLAERIRARIGRLVSHPGSIDVVVARGHVVVSGQILQSEVRRLLAAIGRMPGVLGVEPHLEIHEEPAHVSGLQGETWRPGPRFELLQERWSPAARFGMGLLGVNLLANALQQRRLLGLGLGVVGAGVLIRAVTNLSFRRLIGYGPMRPGIAVRKTITVRAPVGEVYRFWSDVTNYPRFMESVREVRELGDRRYHWVVAGPAGIPVEWDAEITEATPNAVLAWKSLPGSPVEQIGLARFAALPDGGTRVDLQLSYEPPAGAIGHAVATLFGRDPKHALDADLVRFQSLLEQGKTTAHGETVVREDLVPPAAPAAPEVHEAPGDAAG